MRFRRAPDQLSPDLADSLDGTRPVTGLPRLELTPDLGSVVTPLPPLRLGGERQSQSFRLNSQ